ncbi:hypothetical protein ACW0TR_02835, partial [Fusobacterium polymorphum]
MSDFDIEAIQAEVRAMDFVRGTPADIAEWRVAHEKPTSQPLVEDMTPTPNKDSFFDLMLEEALPPSLIS